MPETNSPRWPDTEPCLNLLDASHQHVFNNALANVLSLDVTEKAMAQILDGLPIWEAAGYMPKDHLVIRLEHRTLCDGFLEKARVLLQDFDISLLQFEPWVVTAFQQSVLGTRCFALRLIELVVVACHQIAAALYMRDDGNHPHRLHQEWFARVEQQRKDGKRARGVAALPVAFSHHRFWRPERCPRGDADVAGYWAEGQIFGGVIVFDRGLSGRESKSMWFHGIKYSPSTLYPPTNDQLDALIVFLLAERNDAVHNPPPLPIHATNENRPRWDPWEAQTKFHIFRDKHALYIPSTRTLGCTSIRSVDWPEEQDHRVVADLMRQKNEGKPYDPEALRAALVGACLITPTSPYIHPKPDWYANSVWTGR